jgi:hypothetical protein
MTKAIVAFHNFTNAPKNGTGSGLADEKYQYPACYVTKKKLHEQRIDAWAVALSC